MSDVRCGPFVRGFTRAPASRSIGCESAAMVGWPFRYASAITFFDGLSSASGSGAASNAATTSAGGTRYFGVSAARVVARIRRSGRNDFRVMRTIVLTRRRGDAEEKQERAQVALQ